jgi:hypothetical protein
MRAPTDALLQIERSVAAEKGPFALFALFLREEAPLEKWDLVVSAPWIEENKGIALRLISERIKTSLTASDLLMISRIAIADPSDPAVDAINRAVRVEHSAVEIKDGTFFGQRIKHAHIFASNPAVTQARQPTLKYALQRARRKRARR